MTTASAKTWHDFTTKYRRELVNPMADSIMEKCATVAEASDFLKAVADRIERKVGTTLPGIAGAQPPQGALTPNQCNSLLKSLGQLRALHGSHNSQIHLPKITVHELDHAAVSAAIPRSLLNSLGYDIGKVQYRNMGKQDDAPSSSAVGRRSKVTNEELIKLVGGTLGKYASDSSKVVSIRKMVGKLWFAQSFCPRRSSEFGSLSHLCASKWVSALFGKLSVLTFLNYVAQVARLMCAHIAVSWSER